jgi:hypothetical protein
VVGADGRPAGTGRFAGCDPAGCIGGQVGVTGASVLAAGGGTLLVLSPAGPVPVVAIGDGPAFSAAG